MGRRVIEEESDEESVFSAEESEDEERPSPRRSASRSGGADGGALSPIASHTPMEILAGGIAGASVGTSVAAMIIQPVNIVFAAGALSSVIGPYAYWQQRRLTDVIALQETHKALSEQVDRLGKENQRLHETVVELSDTVDRLEDVEQALDVITQTQGQSIAAFEDQVKDNKEILAKMQSNLKANVLQNLLQVVIRSDKDENMTIEEHEIGDLINRIKRINGVEVHEDKLRERITKSGGSLQCVMDIIRNLMSDECPECDQIFTIKD
uniref:Uncharacterized protein n=1 Tax=Skeletonema marinoi TaxID=267567 RepID=A0A6U3TQ87_9STRA